MDYRSPPKILPWLTRKAGISDTRAAVLWRNAVCFADGISRPGTSVWSKLATDHLLTSLAAEAEQRAQHAGPAVLWLLPARLWLRAAEACERTSLAVTVAYRNQQRAA